MKGAPMTDRDCPVGYKKPPRHSQYEPGRSGNPSGKPKGRKSLKTELLKELSQRIPVTEMGRRRTVPMQTLIIKRMIADAAQGDAKARDLLLKWIDRFEAIEPDQPITAATPAEDLEIMARFRERLVEEIKAQDPDQ